MRTLWAMPIGWLAIAIAIGFDALSYEPTVVRFIGLSFVLGALAAAGITVLTALDRSVPVTANHPLDQWVPHGDLPVELNGWNWGAFALAPWWSLGHRIWWGLLALIPYLGLPVSVYLGVRGSRIAWKRGPWTSAHEFVAVQRTWKDWSKSYLLCLFLLVVVSPLLAAIFVG